MQKHSQIEIGRLLPLLRSRTKARRDDAVAQLCMLFEPLVKKQALNYRQAVVGAEVEDLEQVARVGVVAACKTFKPKTGLKRNAKTGGAFASHVTWSVRHELAEHIAGLQNPVRLPSDLIRRLPKLRRIAQRLEGKLNRAPTAAELAGELGLSETMIVHMLQYDCGPIQLNAPVDSLFGKRGPVGRMESTADHKDLLSSARMFEQTPGPEVLLIERETQRELRRQNNE